MAVERAHIGWKFWLWWLLATTAGWMLGFVILASFPKTTTPALVEGALLTLSGTLSGALQWLVLRRHIRRAGWWVPASAAGWVGGFALFLLLAVSSVSVVEMSAATTGLLLRFSLGAMAGAGVGAATGVLQWLVLRRQVHRAGGWVVASITAWLLAFAGLVLASRSTSATFLGVGAMVGVVVGGITGAALVLLWRSPPIAVISLRIKLTTVFSLLVIMALWGSSFWIYDYAVNTTLDDMTEEIKTLLRVAAAGIDGDEVVMLYRADGLADDARYQEQLGWLETVRGDRPYTIYTFVRTDDPDEVAVVVSTAAPGEGSSTLALPEDSLMWQGFVAPTVSSVEKLSLPTLISELTWQGLDAVVDIEQGAWISGYAPIRNAQGEIVAAVGVDLPVAYKAEMQVNVVTPVRRVFGEMFIPMLIVVFLVSRAITRPLVAVTKAARRIGEGDYDLDLSRIHRVRFRNEISELAEAIEESARAHLREQNLRQQVEKLEIQINEVKRRRQVEAIVEDDFFQDLQARADDMRARRRRSDAEEE
jgi:hypothetical protein